MSWLPAYPYPHKETLRVLYDAYSERYDYYSARLDSNLLAKLSPPEYPASYGAIKNYMEQFAEAINYLFGFSLDTRKLGDWQSSDPFPEDYDNYNTENYAALGIDGKAFWCTDVPLFISSRRIVEAWYTMLNDYIQFPALPINVLAGASVNYTGTITITDWTDDNKYGGNRTIPLSHNVSTPVSTGYIAYFHSDQFRQGVSITGVTNKSTTYPIAGSWEIMGRLVGADEWWETSSNTVNTWQGGTFVITMDGMQGSFSFPADIAAARSRILGYPQDNNDPRVAALNATYRFGDIDNGQLYKVSAENLPATNYKYFDPAE